MIDSDTVGATWGPGVRRAPQTTTWGWNQATVAKTMTPTLMVAGPAVAAVVAPLHLLLGYVVLGLLVATKRSAD